MLCKQYFNSTRLFKLYSGLIRPYLEYCFRIWSTSPLTFLLDMVESKAIHLIGDPSLTSTLGLLSLHPKVASLSLFTAITLVTALTNLLPVIHLQWLSHVPHIRSRLPIIVVRNFPMQELIGSVIVSLLVLPACGTLSHLLYFQLPSALFLSKRRFIISLGQAGIFFKLLCLFIDILAICFITCH